MKASAAMNHPAHIDERQAATRLASRVAEGDNQAEAEMVKRYSRGLRFLLRRKTRNPELAQDLLQETWAIALVKIRDGGLNDPGRLAGYLCGIANNLAQSERRRVNRQRTSINTEIVNLIPDESSSPFRNVSRAEVCKHVHGVLGELNKERDREILKRFYVQDEDKASICSYLGVDSTHFNRVLFRARQRLKSAIEVADRRSRMRVVG
jgi:RNA polymerase sigma-70 factor (ECF subfamily)